MIKIDSRRNLLIIEDCNEIKFMEGTLAGISNQPWSRCLIILEDLGDSFRISWVERGERNHMDT